MAFEYYITLAVNLAADLVNTLQPATGADSLQNERDLTRFLAAHAEAVSLVAEEGLPEVDEREQVRAAYAQAIADWDIGPEDVAAIRALRGPLRRIFAVAASDERQAAELINEQLRRANATPRISWRHGPLHLHFESVEDGCAGWLTATALMGLAVVLCDYGGNRLGICASTPCGRAFVDVSRNASKIYCSAGCAHRESVSAFRARQRASAGRASR